MSRITLPAKYAGETQNVVFDFVSRLATGETISTKVTTAAVYSGTDATPSTIISGAATSSGTQVTQAITAGVIGVTYVLTCTITTSASQTLTMTALLTILPGST